MDIATPLRGSEIGMWLPHLLLGWVLGMLLSWFRKLSVIDGGLHVARAGVTDQLSMGYMLQNSRSMRDHHNIQLLLYDHLANFNASI
jgi:hypothetical protein